MQRLVQALDRDILERHCCPLDSWRPAIAALQTKKASRGPMQWQTSSNFGLRACGRVGMLNRQAGSAGIPSRQASPAGRHAQQAGMPSRQAGRQRGEQADR